ncbi:MAG: hypothetical protein ACP5RX_02260 [Minisyncoccia bacterium]
MNQDFSQFFNLFEEKTPRPELFSKVLFAIKQEELRQRQKKMIASLALFIGAVISLPFTFQLLFNKIIDSGILYLLQSLTSDFHIVMSIWKEFILAILEVVPFTSLLIFAISLEICLFAFHLFLQEKKSRNQLSKQFFAFKI